MDGREPRVAAWRMTVKTRCVHVDLHNESQWVGGTKLKECYF
jgi:hypothetical protein